MCIDQPRPTGDDSLFARNDSRPGKSDRPQILLEYDPKILEQAAQHSGSTGEGGSGAGGGEKAVVPAVLSARIPMIRYSIIRVISSKKAEQVLTPDGKESLKEELIEAINEAIGLSENPIVAIYFTDFIIQ